MKNMFAGILDRALEVQDVVFGALSVVLTAVAHQMGGADKLLTALAAFIVADIITGFMIAAFWHKSGKSKGGGLDSTAMWQGGCRKICICIFVMLAHQMDLVLDVNMWRNGVVFFFLGEEGLSLIENFGLMGLPYPEAVKNVLEQLHDRVEIKEET